MDDKELKELYDEYFENKKKLKAMLKSKDILYPHKRIEFVQLKDRTKYLEEVLRKNNLIH